MIRYKHIEHKVRDLFPNLKEFFNHRHDIEFAYIYGSYARGKENQMSDVDVAVYLNDKISRDKYLNIRLELIGDVAHVLRTDEIDLVILNEASLLLAYEAVSSRIVLYERDVKKRISFETRILDKYFDTEPIRKVQREYFKQQVREGKIFG